MSDLLFRNRELATRGELRLLERELADLRRSNEKLQRELSNLESKQRLDVLKLRQQAQMRWTLFGLAVLVATSTAVRIFAG